MEDIIKDTDNTVQILQMKMHKINMKLEQNKIKQNNTLCAIDTSRQLYHI